MAFIFIEGFSKYHVQNTVNWGGTFSAVWNATNVQNASFTSGSDGSLITSGRFGTDFGYQTRITMGGTNNGSTCIYNERPLGASYGHIIGGCWIRPALSTSLYGVLFLDGASTPQCCIDITSGGTVEFRAGGNNLGWPTTVLASNAAGIGANTDHYLEWDITIGTSAAYQVWLDGVSIISGTGNTRGLTGNNSVNYFGVGCFGGAPNNNTTAIGIIGHIYMLDPSTGTPTARLGDSRVDRLTLSTDAQKQFIANATGMNSGGSNVPAAATNADSPSSWYWGQNPISAGANNIIIRKFKAKTNGVLNYIGFTTNSTAAGAHVQGAIYADNGSGTLPGALLGTTQVQTGVANAGYFMPMNVPVNIVAGTTYWVGFLYDTTINFAMNDTSGHGYFTARSYVSGFPSPWSGALTNWNALLVQLGIQSPSDNFACVNSTPVHGGDPFWGVQSAVVGAEDLYGTTGLPFVPASVYGLSVSAFAAKSDSNARNLSLQCKSGGTDSSGSLGAGGAPLLTSDAYYTSIFPTDPNTGAAWIPADLNNAQVGMKVAL